MMNSKIFSEFTTFFTNAEYRTSEERQMEEHICQSIKDVFSIYSFNQLYLWLAASAVHPYNQQFILRFEIMMACLLSINPDKFANQKLEHSVFSEILEKTSRELATFTSMLEDFEPLFQLKEIPLFLGKEKYYFFYGTYEQPYLIWNRISETIYPVLRKFEHPLADAIKTSLLFQTNLLAAINKFDIEEKSQNVLHVPEEKFLDEIGSHFIVKNTVKTDMKICNSGELYNQESLLNFSVNGGLYNIFYVKNDNNIFYWLPCDHYDSLENSLKNLLKNDTSIRKSIDMCSKGYFCDSLFSLFSLPCCIKNIYSNDKEILTSGIDAAVIVDEQNVILFKLSDISTADSINQTLEDSVKGLKDIIIKILDHDLVIQEFYNGRVNFCPKINYWGVVVSDLLPSENAVIDIELPGTIFCHAYNDLCRCFEKSPTSLFFFNFLIDDAQETNLGCISTDMLDRFEIYLSNNGYLRGGVRPSLVVYSPHDGSVAVQQEMYQKFQDPIYEYAITLLPRQYRYIEKASNAMYYNIYSKVTGAGGMGMLINESLIFACFPWDYIFCEDSRKIQQCSGLLGPLLFYFMERLKKYLSELFECWGAKIKLPKLFKINLIPDYEAREIDFLSYQSTLLTTENPIYAESIIKNNKLLTVFIYSPEYLHDFFNKFTDNTAEKEIFSTLISSWMVVFENITIKNALNKAKLLLERLVGKEQKGFSSDAISVKNPLLNSYVPPYDIDEVELGRIQRRMAEFLVSLKVIPGVYQGEKAKQICNDLCSFLWNNLVAYLNQLNPEALLFIYRQVELAEGMRESKNLETAMQSQIRTEFDLLKKHIEKFQITLKIIEVTKYIFQVAYSLQCHGSQHLTQLLWRQCFAIGWWLDEVSHISEALHFDVASFDLTISDMYELSISYDGSKFDFNDFQIFNSAQYVSRENASYEHKAVCHDSSQCSLTPKQQNDQQWLPIIDAAFLKDINFPFSEYYIVADALRFIECKNMDFPVKIFDNKQHLVSEIHNILTAEKDIKIENISRIIDFMLLNKIDTSSPVLPNKILKSRNRLNISPLFNLRENIAYGNQMTILSYELLTSIVREGAQPFDLSSYPNIKKALDSIHRNADLKLEEEGYLLACECCGKNYVEKNIRNFKRISNSFPQRPDCGEIDILVVNVKLKIIFVVDAKNQKREIYPSGISREEKVFWSKGGHAEKLRKKELFVNKNLPCVLKHFNITDISGWKTRRAFLTKKHYINAFWIKSDIDFVLLSDFVQYLTEGRVK